MFFIVTISQMSILTNFLGSTKMADDVLRALTRKYNENYTKLLQKYFMHSR